MRFATNGKTDLPPTLRVVTNPQHKIREGTVQIVIVAPLAIPQPRTLPPSLATSQLRQTALLEQDRLRHRMVLPHIGTVADVGKGHFHQTTRPSATTASTWRVAIVKGDRYCV